MDLFTITTVASALSDPTRLRMLLLLEGKALAVGELAAGVGIVPSVGTHHLKKLLEAGLISTSHRGRRTLVRRVERRWRQVLEGLGAP